MRAALEFQGPAWAGKFASPEAPPRDDAVRKINLTKALQEKRVFRHEMNVNPWCAHSVLILGRPLAERMNSNSRTLQKNATLVEISLADGSMLLGKLFVSPQARLTDLLNDDRPFLPIESTDGIFVALAKTAIKKVTLPVPLPPVYKGTNPYLILGVKEGVSHEELKKAYHQLCLVNHPDRIRGFGLGTDYQDLATNNMSRINNAYAQALKDISSKASERAS
jgi:DnaJ-domain-containing protein 1